MLTKARDAADRNNARKNVTITLSKGVSILNSLMDCIIYHTQFGWLSTTFAYLTTITLENVCSYTHLWNLIQLPRFLILFCLPNPLLMSSVHC